MFATITLALLAALLGAAFLLAGYRFFLVMLPIWGFFGGFWIGAYAISLILGGGFLATTTGLVVGFVGCEDYTRFFPWPDPKGWEAMAPRVQQQVGKVLDRFDKLGVNFGHEPHPKQYVYNTETALESIDLLKGHARSARTCSVPH